MANPKHTNPNRYCSEYVYYQAYNNWRRDNNRPSGSHMFAHIWSMLWRHLFWWMRISPCSECAWNVYVGSLLFCSQSRMLDRRTCHAVSVFQDVWLLCEGPATSFGETPCRSAHIYVGMCRRVSSCDSASYFAVPSRYHNVCTHSVHRSFFYRSVSPSCCAWLHECQFQEMLQFFLTGKV